MDEPYKRNKRNGIKEFDKNENKFFNINIKSNKNNAYNNKVNIHLDNIDYVLFTLHIKKLLHFKEKNY